MSARLLVLWFGCLLPALAWAAGAEIRLDTETIEVGQAIRASVVVSDGQPMGVPRLTTPSGITASYVGQSSTTQMINGAVSSFVSFRFEVSADAAGTYTIGPAAVAVTDRRGKQVRLQADPVKLRVQPPREGNDDATVTLETGFDPPVAWQGQVVLYHYTLRARREIAEGRWFGHPSEGLLEPSDGMPDRRAYEVADDGDVISVHEVVQPFVVTGTGTMQYDAPAAQLDLVAQDGRGRGVFGMFRRTERYMVRGEPLSLEVRPLPPAPPGFSGLIGDFELRSRVDSRQLRVGDSLTWRLDLIGDGTLEGYKLPPAPEVDGLRIYEGTTTPRGRVRSGTYRATAAFERTIVATAEGRLELPPASIVAFSPSKGDYVTLTSDPVELIVRPGEAGEVTLQSFAEDVALAEAADNDDGPRPLWTRGPDTRLPWLAVLPWALGFAAAPALWLGGQLAGQRLRHARAARAAPPRQATPLERLDRLPDDTHHRLAALDDALRLALALHADTPVVALDRAAVLASLEPDVAREVEAITTVLHRARFAGGEVPTDLVARVRAAVTSLEQA